MSHKDGGSAIGSEVTVGSGLDYRVGSGLDYNRPGGNGLGLIESEPTVLVESHTELEGVKEGEGRSQSPPFTQIYSQKESERDE